VINGESGVRRIERFDVSDSPRQDCREVRNFRLGKPTQSQRSQHVPRTVPLPSRRRGKLWLMQTMLLMILTLDQRRAIGVVGATGGGGLTLPNSTMSMVQGTTSTRRAFTLFPAATHGTLSSELSMVLLVYGGSRHVISTGMHKFYRCDRLRAAVTSALASGSDDQSRCRCARWPREFWPASIADGADDALER